MKESETMQEERRRKRYIRKHIMTTNGYLLKVRELSCMPDSMEPFLSVFENLFVKGGDVPHLPEQKTVGTYCVMVPQELIMAAGAHPVKLCSGSYTAFSIGDDLTPRDACPLVKAVEGSLDIGVMQLYNNCSLMAIPVTCDCKKKLAGYLGQKKRVCTLQIPANREDEDLEQYVSQLYGFAVALEEVTGRHITYDNLAAAMEQSGYAQFELSRFLETKKQTPYLVRGTHALLMMNASAYLSAADWAKQMHLVNRELSERKKTGQYVSKKELPRILLTGSPLIFPNIKIPLLVEEAGGYIAADETCLGERGLSDPVVPVDESFDGLMRSLAMRATRPCSCPTFADNSRRVFRLRQMIRDYRIEGVIYHVLRGCLVYDFEYQKIEEALREENIPVIRVESDYSEEDVEQLRIRMEAFVELIKLKKPAEKHKENLV